MNLLRANAGEKGAEGRWDASSSNRTGAEVELGGRSLALLFREV